jgi:gamma-glutamylcysteine synthetase
MDEERCEPAKFNLKASQSDSRYLRYACKASVALLMRAAYWNSYQCCEHVHMQDFE